MADGEIKRNGRSFFVHPVTGWSFTKGGSKTVEWVLVEVINERSDFKHIYRSKRKALAAIDALIN